MKKRLHERLLQIRITYVGGRFVGSCRLELSAESDWTVRVPSAGRPITSGGRGPAAAETDFRGLVLESPSEVALWTPPGGAKDDDVMQL